MYLSKKQPDSLFTVYESASYARYSPNRKRFGDPIKFNSASVQAPARPTRKARGDPDYCRKATKNSPASHSTFVMAVPTTTASAPAWSAAAAWAGE